MPVAFVMLFALNLTDYVDSIELWPGFALDPN